MARLPNDNIDTLAVSTVEALISLCPRIHPVINKDDKIPIWDGEIIIYRDDSRSKTNIQSVIPVQVKGHIVNTFTKKFEFSKTDLQKFALKRSIFFFVVEIDNNDNRKIYYRSMHQIDIKQTLDSYGGQESKSLTMNEFPQGKNDIEKLLVKFGDEHNNFIFFPGLTSINELFRSKGKVPVSFSVDIPIGSTMEQFVNAIKEQQPYLIYEDPTSNMARIAVDRIKPEHLVVKMNKRIRVAVGKKEFFSNVEILSDGKDTNYICNNKLFYRIVGDTFERNYRLDGTYTERKIVNDFLYQMILAKSFMVDGKEEQASNIENLLDVEQIKRMHEFYEHFDSLIKVLHIEKEPDFTNCTNKDFITIENLYQTIVLGEKFTKISDVDTFNTFKAFGLRILVFIKSYDDYCIIKNWDETEYVGNVLKDSNGNPIFSNIYFILACNNPNGFERFDNINYLKLNEIVSERINDKQDLSLSVLVLLNLIQMYDKESDIRFLLHAEDLSKLLSEKVNESFCVINNLQIKKRKNSLTDDDKSLIHRYLEGDSNLLNKLAYYILLDDESNIKRISNELSPEQKALFNTWPISNLIPKLK